MLERYKNLEAALRVGRGDVFDSLTALAFNLDHQTAEVQNEYYSFLRDFDARFGLDIMVAQRECEEADLC